MAGELFEGLSAGFKGFRESYLPLAKLRLMREKEKRDTEAQAKTQVIRQKQLRMQEQQHEMKMGELEDYLKSVDIWYEQEGGKEKYAKVTGRKVEDISPYFNRRHAYETVQAYEDRVSKLSSRPRYGSKGLTKIDPRKALETFLDNTKFIDIAGRQVGGFKGNDSDRRAAWDNIKEHDQWKDRTYREFAEEHPLLSELYNEIMPSSIDDKKAKVSNLDWTKVDIEFTAKSGESYHMGRAVSGGWHSPPKDIISEFLIKKAPLLKNWVIRNLDHQYIGDAFNDMAIRYQWGITWEEFAPIALPAWELDKEKTAEGTLKSWSEIEAELPKDISPEDKAQIRREYSEARRGK